jgi:hypothetical protein
MTKRNTKRNPRRITKTTKRATAPKTVRRTNATVPIGRAMKSVATHNGLTMAALKSAISSAVHANVRTQSL